MKRASARMTCAPSRSKRSTESCGAIAAMTSCTLRCSAAKLTRGLKSERRTGANDVCPLCRGEHCLGWDAAGIQAFTTHLAAFDQHDPRAELRGDRGGAETSRAGANDAQVDLKILHASFLLADPALV